jgi:hypothetical protein
MHEPHLLKTLAAELKRMPPCYVCKHGSAIRFQYLVHMYSSLYLQHTHLHNYEHSVLCIVYSLFPRRPPLAANYIIITDVLFIGSNDFKLSVCLGYPPPSHIPILKLSQCSSSRPWLQQEMVCYLHLYH